ncbi:hypothetical protein [Fibrobacter sp.]|uniref:hypothetical protein n=1 Tax=Fibrobacter sp. TaxID=35828 RepID=UPI003890539F
MRKLVKLNLLSFLVFVFVTASLVYVLGKMNFSTPFGKPWHLQSSVHEDSLSQEYLNQFQIRDGRSLIQDLYDSSRANLFIMVDAWGVPIQENVLEKELALFEKVPHWFTLHQRLANRNIHAERVELRNDIYQNIYLFGGDSLEYNRQVYIREIGFKKTLFCQKCNDGVMLGKIDSLLQNDSLQLIAWTTQSSRSGDKDSLFASLKLIVDFAARHSDVHIVVQGTHRPVLCESKIRNQYKSHWVPVVVLNGSR